MHGLYYHFLLWMRNIKFRTQPPLASYYKTKNYKLGRNYGETAGQHTPYQLCTVVTFTARILLLPLSALNLKTIISNN